MKPRSLTLTRRSGGIPGGRTWLRLGNVRIMSEGDYSMEWEGVAIPVRVECIEGEMVAIPPSGRSFPLTACPGATWRRV